MFSSRWLAGQNTTLLSVVGRLLVSEGTITAPYMAGSGSVFTWGWNEHGMCGTGHEENVLTPWMLSVPVEKQVEAVMVGSGAGHTILVVRRNQRDIP